MEDHKNGFSMSGGRLEGTREAVEAALVFALFIYMGKAF